MYAKHLEQRPEYSQLLVSIIYNSVILLIARATHTDSKQYSFIRVSIHEKVSSCPLKCPTIQHFIGHEKNVCGYSLQNAHNYMDSVNDFGRKERLGITPSKYPTVNLIILKYRFQQWKPDTDSYNIHSGSAMCLLRR